MHLSFHNLALLVSTLFLLLGAIWMFAPIRLLSGSGVAYSASNDLVGRRLSALYIGIAIMFYMGRNAE